jgi:apocytochrome f
MVKIHMINKSNKFRLMVKGDLNVGVLLLPEGFELAPADRVPEQMKRKLESYITNHIVQNKNILVVGPVAGNDMKWLFCPFSRPINK